MNKIIAKEVLLEAKAILEENEVPFFLIYGTCLGAVRDNGFIATDEDIDLGIMHEDLIPKIDKLHEDFLRHGFRVYGFSYPYNYKRAINIYKYDILIDIRNFEACEKGRFLQRIDSNRYDIANVYSFKNTVPMKFLGHDFYVPENTETYLEENYGPDWRTPEEGMHFSYAGEKDWWKKLGRRTVIVKKEINREKDSIRSWRV